MAAACLASGWSYNSGIERSWLYGLIAFFGTVAVYNFQRVYKVENGANHSAWLQWVGTKKMYLKWLTIISVSIAIVFMVLFTSIKAKNVFFLLVLFVISLMYVIPIKRKSLRELPGLKSFFIAFVWTGFVVVYPLMNEHVLPLPARNIFAFFCFFFALTIPFDIRDLQFDPPTQKTIPQVLGIKGSKLLAVALLIAFYLFTANFNQEIWKNSLFGLVCSLIIGLFILTTADRSTYFFATIDAMMILLGLWFFV